MVKPENSVEPRKAAAGIILHGGAEPEVLLARRNTSLRFMGGHHVFPGGRIEADDEPALVTGAPDNDTAQAIFAVVREVFEETGLLLTRGVLPEKEDRREARAALTEGRAKFAALLKAWGHSIHAPHFTPAGIWITPRWSPIRFYTRYFIYRFEGERYEEVLDPDGEIVGLDWLTAVDARQKWHRHEMRLSTPIAFVLRYLAALPMEDALPHLHKNPHEAEEPTLFEMRRGVHIFPLFTHTLPPADRTNCVIIGERELWVIDPGATDPAEQQRLREQLDGMCAIGGSVAGVLLTHGHRDHAGSAAFLHEVYGAPVWAHAGVAVQADVPIARTLEDGDVLTLGDDGAWRLRVFHTPGHDPNHLCFLEETTHTLMAGDMLANPGTIVIAPGLGGDMTVYLEQLERLAGVSFNYLIPGHGLPLGKTAGVEKLRGLIAHRLQREARIQAALDAGHRSILGLLENVYADTPREMWPLATQQLQAHLVRLGVPLESLD
jgi:glyoxylase-like metal-dependent hydrolase (beta-lactamase superfamily II)/8-oxo-dGTP pyrophosphatase MutT (NUDIX family)